ncbi:MAG: hypothetical protein L6Q98_16305 [Anaerolineae bacterium]|nr:hypothetical protein [Anaerolineae bacterium]NUQ04241.1 hypothetical protein [Anaerolineae bacterium]
MARPTIPERQPIGDSFAGYVVITEGTQALAAAPPPDCTILASGAFVVRYGLRLLGKPHLSIVPGLVVIDYGTMLTGEDAWEFIIRSSNRYPRAEVFGWREDGREDMLTVKLLDLALPPQVLVYADALSRTPVAAPTRLIAPDDAPITPRLRQNLMQDSR